MKLIIAATIFAISMSGAAFAAKKTDSEKAWAKEPTSFLGVDFSSNVENSTPKCEKAWSHEEDKLCHKPEILGTYFMEGVPSLGTGYGYELRIKVVDNKIDYFNIETKSAAFSALSNLFIEKYGQPTSRASEKVKTKAGAEFTNETLIWKGKKVSIVIEKYSSDINTTSARLRSNALAEEAARAADAASKAAAAKL